MKRYGEYTGFLEWFIYSMCIGVLLFPLKVDLGLSHLAYIGLALILGFFAGLLNAIRTLLDKDP